MSRIIGAKRGPKGPTPTSVDAANATLLLFGKARSMKYRVLTVSALCVIAAGLAVSGLPRGVRADHIPNHDNDDPIFPVPIPGQEFFSGGILFVTAIGPQAGQ